MCVSKEQKSALAEDQAFGKQLRESYSTDFSESQQIFRNLNTNLEGIIAAGESQTGMSPVEESARRSQAINDAAAANKNIQAAIGEKAAMTGSVPGVESGVTEAVRAKAMSDVESNLANEQADITKQNYALGRENYQAAVKNDMSLPSATFTPVTEAGAPANTANKTTGDQATENQKASSSWLGLMGGLAGKAVGGFTGGGGFLAPKTTSA